MSLLALVAQTVMVTPSGALSPGPLTTAAAAAGASRSSLVRGASAGLRVAAGHMAFELPYVLALGYISTFLGAFKQPLAVVTLASAVFFAYLIARDGVRALRGRVEVGKSSNKSAFASGVVFTGANPYFLLWWATVGLPLVSQAFSLGPIGIAAMYASHVWMDYAWLALIAALGGGASNVVGARRYGLLLLALAALLLLFGVNTFASAFFGISII